MVCDRSAIKNKILTKSVDKNENISVQFVNMITQKQIQMLRLQQESESSSYAMVVHRRFKLTKRPLRTMLQTCERLCEMMSGHSKPLAIYLRTLETRLPIDRSKVERFQSRSVNKTNWRPIGDWSATKIMQSATSRKSLHPTFD